MLLMSKQTAVTKKAVKQASKARDPTVLQLINVHKIDATDMGINEYHITLSGPRMNNGIFTHTIVRTVVSLVGSYAFSGENIKFEKNTTIFNRDQIRLRISNIPILYKDYEYPNYAERCVQLEKDVNEIDPKELSELEKIELDIKKKQSMVDNIHMYVNAINDTSDIMYVTSNAKYTTFYKDGVTIPDIYPREVSIIALQPGQEINFTAVSDFDIPMRNGIYRAAYSAFHREIDENTFRLSVKSYRQIPDEQIVIEACNIIILKLNNLQSKIFLTMSSEEFLELNPDPDYKGELVVENENHTMAEIFTRRIQDHVYIMNAAFIVRHPDENNFVFRYEANGASIKKIIDEVINELVADYTTVINFVRQ